MSPEAQRVAIAEACGWTDVDWNGIYSDFTGKKPGSDRDTFCIPDYLNSLDAVIPVVTQLIGGDVGQDLQARHRFQIFIRELMKLTSGRWAPDWPDCDSYGRFSVIHMMLNLSPDKITEALLRTLNLWTE